MRELSDRKRVLPKEPVPGLATIGMETPLKILQRRPCGGVVMESVKLMFADGQLPMLPTSKNTIVA